MPKPLITIPVRHIFTVKATIPDEFLKRVYEESLKDGYEGTLDQYIQGELHDLLNVASGWWINHNVKYEVSYEKR